MKPFLSTTAICRHVSEGEQKENKQLTQEERREGANKHIIKTAKEQRRDEAEDEGGLAVADEIDMDNRAISTDSPSPLPKAWVMLSIFLSNGWVELVALVTTRRLAARVASSILSLFSFSSENQTEVLSVMLRLSTTF